MNIKQKIYETIVGTSGINLYFIDAIMSFTHQVSIIECIL